MKRRMFVSLGLAGLLAALITTQSSEEAPSVEPAGPSVLAEAPAPSVTFGPASAAPEIQVAPTPAPSAALFESGQRMVRLADPMDLDELAATHGVQVLRAPGRSGYALVGGDERALVALGDDPRVASMVANGRTHGAATGAMEPLQWHLGRIRAKTNFSNPSQYVVAVLDTGVAYETATRLGVSYSRAPSLASSPIVAPYDFINDDPYANDDHQHGTHIASVIASNGAVKGTAPGVSLMPLKVLDQDNAGTEFALIEALYHAIDNGADVVNMSLSFGEGYAPSLALLEALEAASDAGLVLVGASGNDGSDMVSWPAAHPRVIAVGSSRPKFSDSHDYYVADYSNISGAIDAMAPGGDITADLNNDGLVDGVLAETINPSDPTDVGYWLMAGTSQAAAIVSGLAVRVLSLGVPSDEVFIVLQDNGRDGRVHKGTGGGSVDFDNEDSVGTNKRLATFYVSMYPYLRPYGTDKLQPVARFTAFDENGALVPNLDIIASIWGNGDGMEICTTGANGVCEVKGAAVLRNDASGNSIPRAWSIAVDCVEHDASDLNNIGYKPVSAMTATPAFQDLLAAVQADPTLSDALLAWSWTSTTDAVLGPVEAGFSVVDSGSGFASIPLGLVMTPGALGGLGSVSGQTVDVDGMPVQIGLVDLDGSGLASIPLGLQGMKLLTLDGSGLASIPLGLRAGDAHGAGGDLFPMGGVGFASIPLGLLGTPLGSQLGEGGWRVDGYAAASALGGSSQLGIMSASAVSEFGTETTTDLVMPLTGSGAGVVPVP